MGSRGGSWSCWRCCAPRRVRWGRRARSGCTSPPPVTTTRTAPSTAACARRGIGAADPDAHFALGDLSYGVTGQEQAWCDFVTSRVGAGFPFELLAGNHESNGLNGNINDFAACLPNQLPGLVGTYGRQYYVDVPQDDPLVRYVMISPGIDVPRRHVELRRGHAALRLDPRGHRRGPPAGHPLGGRRHAQAVPVDRRLRLRPRRRHHQPADLAARSTSSSTATSTSTSARSSSPTAPAARRWRPAAYDADCVVDSRRPTSGRAPAPSS